MNIRLILAIFVLNQTQLSFSQDSGWELVSRDELEIWRAVVQENFEGDAIEIDFTVRSYLDHTTQVISDIERGKLVRNGDHSYTTLGSHIVYTNGLFQVTVYESDKKIIISDAPENASREWIKQWEKFIESDCSVFRKSLNRITYLRIKYPPGSDCSMTELIFEERRLIRCCFYYAARVNEDMASPPRIEYSFDKIKRSSDSDTLKVNSIVDLSTGVLTLQPSYAAYRLIDIRRK